MSVRCKFRVESKEKSTDGDTDTVAITMRAVTSGSEENAAFWKYTPAGQLTFYTVNASAADQLELGKEYYLDISPAAP